MPYDLCYVFIIQFINVVFDGNVQIKLSVPVNDLSGAEPVYRFIEILFDSGSRIVSPYSPVQRTYRKSFVVQGIVPVLRECHYRRPEPAFGPLMTVFPDSFVCACDPTYNVACHLCGK